MRWREPRTLAYLAVFGTLWGAWEITVGSVLHLINLPLKGTWLAAGAMTLALTGRRVVRVPGALLMMGALAALLKVFSFGGVVFSPMVAILMEALLAEGVLWLGRERPWAYPLAGGVALLWPPIHRGLFQALYFGTEVYQVYLQLARQVTRWLPISLHHLVWALVVLMVLQFLIGMGAGVLALHLARRIEPRP